MGSSPEGDGQAHALPVGRMVPASAVPGAVPLCGQKAWAGFCDFTWEEDIMLWTLYPLKKGFPISSLPRPSCINPLPPIVDSKQIACIESPFILMKK